MATRRTAFQLAAAAAAAVVLAVSAFGSPPAHAADQVQSAPVVTSGPLPNGVVGQDYSFTVTATGLPAPTFSAIGLPDGLGINSETGLISGDPTSGGPAHVTVTASNGISPDATADYDIDVGAAPVITSDPLPDGVVLRDYDVTVTADGEPAPTFTATGLPTGMSIDPISGEISGSLLEAGVFHVTVTASNGVGADAVASYDVTIGAPAAITSDPLPDGVVGQAYDFTVTADGFPAPSFSATGLPDGLDLDSTTGEITGTPTTAGTAHVTLTANNGVIPDASAGYDLTIGGAAPAITSGTLPDGVVGQEYAFTVTADGVPAPTFSATGLPDGLGINSETGKITGMPTTAGPASVTVTASNGIGEDATAAYDITIGTPPAIVSGVLPDGVAGQKYSFAVSASGSPAPTFSAVGLPAGLAIDPHSGVVSGTPATAGRSHVVVTASNGIGSDATADYDVTVDAAPVITSGALPGGIVGQGYDFAVTATGLPVPTFSATGLPNGLGINPESGEITGTPTSPGPAHVTLTASNGIAPDASVSYVLTVAPPVTPALTFTPSPLDFGPVAVGSVGTEAVALTNAGNVILSLAPAVRGPFTVDRTVRGDCGSSLAPGSTCTLHVQFRPTRPGAASGTLTVTEFGTTWTDALSGTTPAPFGFSPSPLDFGQAPVGATTVKVLTLSNPGTRGITLGTLSFNSPRFRQQPLGPGDCQGSVPAGGSCTLHIGFRPAAAGPVSGTLTVQAAGAGWTEALTGIGGGPVFSPSPLDFGQVPLNATTVQVLTLSNPSLGPVPIGGVSIDNPRFRQEPRGAGDCSGSIPPEGSCTLHIGLRPSVAGPVSGTLTVQAAGGSWPEALAGIGGGPVFSPSPLDFGVAPVGATTVKVLTLSNPSTSALPIGAVGIDNPQFRRQPASAGECVSSVPAGGSCTLHIGVHPNVVGPVSGTLTVTSFGMPWTEALTATGGGPTLSPSPLDFGVAPVRATTVKVLRLSNPSDRALPLPGPTFSDRQFSVQPATGDCAKGSIPAQGSCTLHIGFTPAATGPVTGTVSFGSAGVSSTETLTGIGGGLTLSPFPLDFGVAPVRATTVEVLTLTNPSTRALLFDRPIFSDRQFSVQPATGDCVKGTVPAQGSCTLHIGFDPVGQGSVTGALTVSIPGATSIEALTGVGGGAAPIVTVSPASLDFGGVPFDATSSPQRVTVINTGSAPLQIDGLTVVGEFAVSREPKDCLALGRLAEGAHCTVAVTFSPTTFGPKTGTLTLTGSGGSLPPTSWPVALTGQGTRPRPGA